MSIVDCIKLPNNSTYNITLPLLSSGFTTTAGSSTSGSYLAAKWAVANVNGITTPIDGMTIAVRVPLAGNSGGILLSIDGGTKYYPIVRNVNTLVTTNYGVGATIVLTFNSTQTAQPYTTSNTKETITGCWQVADYDSNTQSNTNSTDTSSKIFLVGATSQGSNKTTYSHGEVYVGTDHHVYSNSKQTVNLSDTQALTNKTYNGYTLGAACAKGVDTTATSGSANLITSGAMYTALSGKAASGHTHDYLIDEQGELVRYVAADENSDGVYTHHLRPGRETEGDMYILGGDTYYWDMAYLNGVTTSGDAFNIYPAVQEGHNTTASGTNSHAEGNTTTASGSCSHTEGYSTSATNSYSHAEGCGTTASGTASHAEGAYTTAGGLRSHAEGQYTVANSENQHVQGAYNVADASKTYAHIVGNGTADDARSNAHTLDWDGNAWFAGGGEFGADLTVETQYLPTLSLNGTNVGRKAQMTITNIGHAGFYNVKDDNNRGVLYVMSEADTEIDSLLQLAVTKDGTETFYDIWGEHSKPKGNYSGNGSTTSRTINIGAYGVGLMITSSQAVTIVGRGGAIIKKNTATSVTLLKNTEASFYQGVLTLATSDVGINGNAVAYTYQLI